MKRAALFVGLLALLPISVAAQSATNTQSFTAAGTDASPTYAGGYNTCSLQVSGTWTGFTVTPKASSDNGQTYPQTITTIGGGSITSNGNYSGTVAGLANTTFEYVVSGASPTGTIVITKTCNIQLSSLTLSAGSSSSPQYVIGRDATTASQGWTIDGAGGFDGNAPNTNLLHVASYNLGYNGTSYDRFRTAAGITGGSAPTGLPATATCNGSSSTGNCASVLYNALLTMTGGSTPTPIAAGSAGPNVIKASAGRLSRVVITTAGTTGTDIFYDNASACSGTIIGEIAGTTALSINVAGGAPFAFDMPALNGITECGGTGSAAVTVSYY